MKKIIVPVILGPTAVGKTAFAVRAALEFGYEIISCDSRQIYRRMDVGTAKPTAAERASAAHHLIDIRDPSEPYSAFAFAEDALSIIRKGAAAGKKVLICGGTGLYFHILMSGAGSGLDEADFKLRGELTRQAEEFGTPAMHERLAAADPEAAAKIHPNDLQRILRALDIIYRKGETLSSLQKEEHPPHDIEFKTIVMTRPRDELYDRINKRAEDMVYNGGLWEEFLSLRRDGYCESSPGMACVGYRELFAVERGETDIAGALEHIKQNSRRYAKRQMTWFRNKTAGEGGGGVDIVDVADKRGDFLCDWLMAVM